MKQDFKTLIITFGVVLLLNLGLFVYNGTYQITTAEILIGFAGLSSLIGLTLWSNWRNDSTVRTKFYRSLLVLGVITSFIYMHLRISLEVSTSLLLMTCGLPFVLWFFLIPGLIIHKKRTWLDLCFKLMNNLIPQSLTSRKYQAQWEMEEHNYEAAIQHASVALEGPGRPLLHISPQDSTNAPRRKTLTKVHQIRRDAYLMIGDGEYAWGDAHVLVQAYPYEAEPYIARGIAYLLANDLDVARIDLNRGLSMPTQPHERVLAQTYLGLIDYIAGNYEAAAQAYWRALRIKLNPDERRQYTPFVYINIGLMAFHTGDQAKAWKAYKKAFKLSPRLPAVRAGLALLHAAQGEWDKAEAMWRVLIQEYSYFIHPDVVIQRHFRWTPAMAQRVHQIQPYVQDDITKHLTLSQEQRLLEVTEPPLPEERMTQNILRS